VSCTVTSWFSTDVISNLQLPQTFYSSYSYIHRHH